MNSIKLDQESEQALILEEAYHLGYHKVKNGCLQEQLVKLNAYITEQVRLARVDELERFVVLMNAVRVDDGFVPVEYTVIQKRISELQSKEAVDE